MISQVDIDDDKVKKLRDDSDRLFFKSGFKFLIQQNGLRLNALHLLIGVPSGGKSTFRNSIIFDFIKHNPDKKVLLWLSEEKLEDFERDISRNYLMVAMCKNIKVFSEQDEVLTLKENKESSEFIAEIIIKSGCDLFIYDNITTSMCTLGEFEKKEEFFYSLKEKITKLNVASLLLAHTGAEIKEGHGDLIDQNNIRGSKTIVNLAQFLYVLQGFHIKEKFCNTIRIVKHRGQSPDHKLFMLRYVKETRIYDKDIDLTHEEFSRLYKNRNKLRQS